MKKIKPMIFYIILFLFILAFCTTALAYDYDLWARLIVGMGVVQTGHVFKHDFLSYMPTHTWYDHEWGSSVIFYLTQHFWGAAGILFLQAILIFLIFFVISKTIELRGIVTNGLYNDTTLTPSPQPTSQKPSTGGFSRQSPLKGEGARCNSYPDCNRTTHSLNFLFYYAAFIAMADSLNHPIRCQMFSFLFFTVFLYILEKVRLEKSSTKTLIWLPVIMLVWNNLHGGCVSGIGLILLYIVGEALNKKPFKHYIYALLGSVAVLPINPWGFEYLIYLIKANTMQRSYVTEWAGLFSKHYVYARMKFKIYALIMLLTEFGVMLKQIKAKTFNFDKTKFLVIAATLFLALQHIKLIPFAVIALAVFLYDDYYTALNTLTKNFFIKIATVKDTIVYIIILFFAFSRINAKAFQPIINYQKYPVIATEFIRLNNLKGNLMVSFGYGSYVSYKLYPNVKIFIDGRYEEVYYDFMLDLQNKFYLLKPNWDEVLKKYPPDIMIIEKSYPVYMALLRRKEYSLVYEDADFGVFVTQKLAKGANGKFKKPSLEDSYYAKTLFNTNEFAEKFEK